MSTLSPLDGLVNIIALTHRFQQIRRKIYATGEDRFENDAEHSFQLALTAWYLIEKEKLTLDKEKVFMYALCHDLTEAYAGDVSFYRTPEEEKEKMRREEEALGRIRDDFSDFPSLFAYISAYEKREDSESKFVYALDKILPILNITLDDGRSWKHLDVSFEMLCHGKYDKVAHHTTIQEYYTFIVEMLKENLHLFPKNLSRI